MTNDYFKIETIADGVFAVLATDMEKALGNAAIIDLGDRTLVLDTFASVEAGNALRDVAHDLTGRLPRWVVNSHHHGDHVLGNQCFVDSADFIATQKSYDGMVQLAERVRNYRNTTADELVALRESDRSENAEQIAQLETLLNDLDNLRLTLPTIIYAEKLVLKGSQRTVEICTFGGGHTQSDSFIYVPDDGIVLMADLLFQGEVHPWAGDGDPRNG